jgi:hypothetical protein
MEDDVVNKNTNDNDVIMVKYPDITVRLSGQDGNPAFIIGRVMRILRRGGVPEAKISEFVAEAKSGDYDHVLQTVMRWVDVE